MFLLHLVIVATDIFIHFIGHVPTSKVRRLLYLTAENVPTHNIWAYLTLAKQCRAFYTWN